MSAIVDGDLDTRNANGPEGPSREITCGGNDPLAVCLKQMIYGAAADST